MEGKGLHVLTVGCGTLALLIVTPFVVLLLQIQESIKVSFRVGSRVVTVMRLLPLIVVPLASARVVNSQHQVPIIEQFVDDVAPQVVHVENSLAYETPAIGVHFTTSYALAAARFPNGMTKELVKVNGDAEYIELVRRWMGIRQESWEDEW